MVADLYENGSRMKARGPDFRELPLSADRSVRFLTAPGQASTSRVLNLIQIARANKDNPEHAALPLFRSPIVNQSFVLKHRMRIDENYLFHSGQAVATKLIVPFDVGDLKAGAARCSSHAPKLVDAEELAAIFQDFLSGFPESDKGLSTAHQSPMKRPQIIAAD